MSEFEQKVDQTQIPENLKEKYARQVVELVRSALSPTNFSKFPPEAAIDLLQRLAKICYLKETNASMAKDCDEYLGVFISYTILVQPN